MRDMRLCGLILGGLLLVSIQASAVADVIDDAVALMQARQYDRAIEILEEVVAKGDASAEAYNELGRAYHWKKDYDSALKNYRQAAKMDKSFLTSPLPILDHFKLYDEIIQIGEAVLSRGDNNPGVLTALLNAYYDTKNSGDYDRILAFLKEQRYSDPYDADYQHYILAKAEVRAGRHEQAIAYIGLMRDRSLLQFMRTASDFIPISNDPRFLHMTE